MEFWLDIGTIVVMIGAALSYAVGFARWVVKRQEEQREELGARIDNVHNRINEVRSSYMRRDDFENHLNRLEKMLDRVDNRIDSILQLLMQQMGARTQHIDKERE